MGTIVKLLTTLNKLEENIFFMLTLLPKGVQKKQWKLNFSD
jgi:hypothetical protein